MNDIYSKNGILINKLNITDGNQLKLAEADIVATKIAMILENNEFAFDKNYFKKIHEFLFGDIYDFAGKTRKINIEKAEPVLGGLSVTFSDKDKIDNELDLLFREEVNYEDIPRDKIVPMITNFMIKLWRIHTFREGNTRTLMVFMKKYLDKLNIKLNVDILINNISYFRKALVRATFEDKEIGFYSDLSYLLKIMNDAIDLGRTK